MKYLQLAHTGACTKLKERHINSGYKFAYFTISTFWSMYKATNKDIYFVVCKIT